jgi:hypothetical protein
MMILLLWFLFIECCCRCIINLSKNERHNIGGRKRWIYININFKSAKGCFLKWQFFKLHPFTLFFDCLHVLYFFFYTKTYVCYTICRIKHQTIGNVLNYTHNFLLCFVKWFLIFETFVESCSSQTTRSPSTNTSTSSVWYDPCPSLRARGVCFFLHFEKLCKQLFSNNAKW